ncbi:hypothetical protein BW21_3642 [Burkholderia humptydooensis]|nr:hypothetical protein BW21_3642 [Burkholderia sp. 2002721687]
MHPHTHIHSLRRRPSAAAAFDRARAATREAR